MNHTVHLRKATDYMNVVTQKENKVVFAVKHRDDNVRMFSRSGGAFTALSDVILQSGGVVYGCVLANHFKAQHIRVVNSHDRDKMRGSKYVQSEMNNCFADVKKDLTDGRTVLFSGTPCQVGGLLSYLREVDVSRLITLDIVCHGVPSPLIWKNYILWQEEKHGTCQEVNFRNKNKFGWRATVETLTFNDESVDSRVFATLFYSHTILRESCAVCKYKSPNRIADITIGDFWGIENVRSDWSTENKGVSLVMLNSEKGERLFRESEQQLDCVQTVLANAMQLPLIKAEGRLSRFHTKFWQDYYRLPFNKIVNRYGGLSFTSKLIKLAKKYIRK